ncbi:MAG: response regulator, partial [Fluviibacter sp.]
MRLNDGADRVRVYLIEDDDAILKSCEQALTLEEFNVRTFKDATSFLNLASRQFPYVVITDVNLPDESGISVMHKVLAKHADVPVIIMTGHGDINMAVDSMKEGAFDFIEKPFSFDRLVTTVRNAVEKAALIDRYELQRSRYEGPTGIVGVLHDACNTADVPAIGLWAAVPAYASQVP